MLEQIGKNNRSGIKTIWRSQVYKWIGCMVGVLLGQLLPGQSGLFNVETSYIGCDSVGTIRIKPKDPSQKYLYSMVSNDCGFPIRPVQDSGVFTNLRPCQYIIKVMGALGTVTLDPIRIGFKIANHMTLKCNSTFATLSQIKVTGGLAVAYSIDFLPKFKLGQPDSVFNLPTLDYLSVHELTVYDSCGHTDKVRLDHVGAMEKRIQCDDVHMYSVPLAKTTYNPFFLNDTLIFKWTLNGKVISTGSSVQLDSIVPGNKLVFQANSSYCTIKDSAILLKEPSRKVDLTIDADRQVLCNKDSLVLKANASAFFPVSYLWSTRDTIGEITVHAGGEFELVATTDEGCTDTADITIRESALAFTSRVTPNLCFGEAKGSIDLDLIDGILPVRYTWSDSVKVEDRENLDNGKYLVFLRDSAGCAISDSFTITSPAPLSLTLSAHAADCIPARNGAVTTMMTGGVPPYRYQWSNGLTVPNADTLSPGSYTITIFDQNQCSVFFPFRIDDLNPLQHFQWDTICANGSLKVGQSVYSKTGRYSDTLISVKGCDSVVTTYLLVNGPVDFTFTKQDPSCNGVKDGGVTITDAIGYADYDVYLNEQKYLPIQLSALAPGNYVIKLKDHFGCFKEKGFALTNPPLIDFDLGGDKTITFGDTLSVNPMTNLTPGNIKQISWVTDPPQPNCIFCNAIFKYKPSDDHYLKATIESISGCKVSEEIRITLDRDFKVFVPNIFSPGSGSLATNQYLTVQGGSQVSSIDYFRIFNRYGDLVFEARDFEPNDAGNAWDGLFKGSDAVPGVYIYVAEVRFADGSVRVVKGDVTLVR